MYVEGAQAQTTFNKLLADRNSYTTRGERNADVTVPALFPKEGDNGSTLYRTPYQSVGARGLNNLASKMCMALFPSNVPFFRLGMTDRAKADLQINPDQQSQVEEALARIERGMMLYINNNQIRPTLYEAIKQLLLVGNCCLLLPPDKEGMKLYKLRNYVCARDALGNVVEAVTVDRLAYATLPEDVQQIVNRQGQEPGALQEYDIYTHVYLDGNKFRSYQEIQSQRIPDTEQEFPVEKSPWIFPRLFKEDGESYGRSYVEEYIGDLNALEAMSMNILEATAIAARVVFLVNPNGVTSPRQLAQAKSGDFVKGRRDDINALTLDKYADLQVVKTTMDGIEARLSFVFLLNSALQRNAERVTAEEIRFVARELEDTLGGIYSLLSQELQLPLVRRLLAHLQQIGEIPPLPDGAVEPAITTGMEALGRGQDLEKLNMFMSYVQGIPEIAQSIKTRDLTIRIATALGINPDGLIKTPEEIQQEQQQAAQLQLADRAAPQLVQAATQQQQG